MAGVTLYSSTHVQKFDSFPYTSATDSYHINYNTFFPDGVDTILINSMNGEDKGSTIILSDETFLRIYKEYQNHFDILLETKNNRFRIASYLYSKRIHIQLPDRSKNQSLKSYGVLINNDYIGDFTYSILYFFFYLIILFLTLILYSFQLRKHRHNYLILSSYGAKEISIFLLSLLPPLLILSVSSLIGGILSLIQVSYFTCFLFGIPTFLTLVLLFSFLSFFLFRRSKKKQ